MPLAGNALVAIWNDILPESRDDFFEWHPREHMVERLGIDGFLRGRRYIALDDSVEFLTLYEVRQREVLASDGYLARVTNPTPWSSRVLPAFRNNARGACKLLFSQGHAMGGCIATIRLEAKEGHAETLDQAITEQVLPQLIAQPHLCGMHYVVNDVALTSGNAGNQRGRVITLPERIVLVEGISAAALQRLLGDRLSAQTWQALGAKASVQTGLYQLEYSIQNLAA